MRKDHLLLKRMPPHPPTHWILYSRGRVWVHHLSLSSGHHRNGDWRWPPLLIAVLAVADLVFLLFIYVCKWVLEKKPPLEWWPAVAATADCHFGSGLNSSSAGELKLYLDWKRNIPPPSHQPPLYFFQFLCTFPVEHTQSEASRLFALAFPGFPSIS